MTSIYRNATQVLIWLGTCEEPSILELVQKVSEGLKPDWDHYEDHPSPFKTYMSREKWEALLVNIIQRDWFYRVWYVTSAHVICELNTNICT
jgi:hypothetical protein